MTFSQEDLTEKVEDLLEFGQSGQAVSRLMGDTFNEMGMEREGNQIWLYLSNGQRVRIDVVLESDG